MDFGEDVAVDGEKALGAVGEAGEGGIGEEGEDLRYVEQVVGGGRGGGWGGEEDLGAVGVVPGALAGVGEDLVGIEDGLEGGGGVWLGDAGGDELVGVELEGELLVGRSDFFLGAVSRHAQDLVKTSPLLHIPLAHLEFFFFLSRVFFFWYSPIFLFFSLSPSAMVLKSNLPFCKSIYKGESYAWIRITFS